MKKIKNQLKILLAIAMLLIPIVGASKTFAAPTGTVAATVTPLNISVTVADGAVAYGPMDVSTSIDTTAATAINDTQVATNNGNVAEDFNIMSSNAVGGTDWTLAGTIGADQYKHSFCVTGTGAPDLCDTNPVWNAMSGGYSSLASNIAAVGTQRFDLKIDTPSSVSDYVEKSITVTVQAVMH